MPWLNQEDCLLRKSSGVLPKLGRGQSRQCNNFRFMSELGVNSSTGCSPSLIKQAHFPGPSPCALTAPVHSAGRMLAYEAAQPCVGRCTGEPF